MYKCQQVQAPWVVGEGMISTLSALVLPCRETCTSLVVSLSLHGWFVIKITAYTKEFCTWDHVPAVNISFRFFISGHYPADEATLLGWIIQGALHVPSMGLCHIIEHPGRVTWMAKIPFGTSSWNH